MDAASDRLVAAARLAGKHLPAHMRADFEALFAPQVLAVTAGVLAAWAAAHAFGLGFAVDITLLVVGFASLGFVAFQAADSLVAYVTTAVGAQSQAELELAGQHLARAISLLGVQTFVALITRGAAKRIGVRASYPIRVARLERIVQSVGTKSHVPVVRARILEALRFLETSFAKMSDEAIVSRLKAIDFSKPVEVVELPAGTQLIAYRPAGSGGSFFSVPGTPMDRLGISTAGRDFLRYQTTRPVKVLRSRAAAANDTWTPGRSPTFRQVRTAGGLFDTGERVGGGGLQYILPEGSDAVTAIGR